MPKASDGESRREWVGWGRGVALVIKTFHDIRVCEVPRADHWDHCVKSIFLLLIVVQRGRTTARGVVVVYSDCSGNKKTQFSTLHTETTPHVCTHTNHTHTPQFYSSLTFKSKLRIKPSALLFKSNLVSKMVPSLFPINIKVHYGCSVPG